MNNCKILPCFPSEEEELLNIPLKTINFFNIFASNDSQTFKQKLYKESKLNLIKITLITSRKSWKHLTAKSTCYLIFM